MQQQIEKNQIIQIQISPDDLLNFHISHFGGKYPSYFEKEEQEESKIKQQQEQQQQLQSSIKENRVTNINKNLSVGNNNKNNNNNVISSSSSSSLGYYSDGTKRTLTDQDIQYFRAREIHQKQFKESLLNNNNDDDEEEETINNNNNTHKSKKRRKNKNKK